MHVHLAGVVRGFFFLLCRWHGILPTINPHQVLHISFQYVCFCFGLVARCFFVALVSLFAIHFVALVSQPSTFEMENPESSGGGEWWLYVLLFRNGCSRFLLNSQDIFGLDQWPLYVALVIAAVTAVLASWLIPGGCAWAGRHKRCGHVPIPGPKGWPVIGSLMDMSIGLAHRKLEYLARLHGAKKLMAFSLGSTPAVITSDPEVARELLNSPHFANRPLKQSAQQLLFGRAIGFAPNGDYWRLLRRISSTHLFSPRRIAAHEPGRQADALGMLVDIQKEYECKGVVRVRPHLQGAALNNIMGSVFGRRFDMSCSCEEVKKLREMVDEGFELLGAFNWADHLPWLRPLDPLRIHARCARLVPRVRGFVRNIIEEHRSAERNSETGDQSESDFVDVLLSLHGEDKVDEEDMIAVLWVFSHDLI